jgi:hypothetical protein
MYTRIISSSYLNPACHFPWTLSRWYLSLCLVANAILQSTQEKSGSAGAGGNDVTHWGRFYETVSAEIYG